MLDEQTFSAGEGNDGGAPVASDVAEYMAAASQAAPAADTGGAKSTADYDRQGGAYGQDGEYVWNQFSEEGHRGHGENRERFGNENRRSFGDESKAKFEDENQARLEREIENALADERTPRWFKNAIENVYKPKLADFDSKLKSIEAYGDVPQIVEKLEMLQGLETIRSNAETGLPERTTEPFVQQLYERQPETALQLIDDLVNLPSPYTQGYTVLQELLAHVGIDPARMPDLVQFAANGYQLTQAAYPPPHPQDLEAIPQHLRATFSQMSPEERDEMLGLSDHNRNRLLEDARFRIQEEGRREAWQREEEQRTFQQRQQQEAQFQQQLATRAFENFSKAGETVFTSFVDSLAQQAGLSKMDSLMIANTVLNSFEDTLAGRQSLDVLKAEGIDLDPTIAPTIKALEEVAGHIAYFETRGERSNAERAIARQVELQERLIAKGNKLIASLAQKRSAARAASAGSGALARGSGAHLNGHPSTIGAGGQLGRPFSGSDEDYEALIQATGGIGSRG
jgi:hypothetical protein